MALFMDYHHGIDGLTADAVADAHRRDLEIQGAHDVKYLRYWYDEGSGAVFCLVEAPSAAAATKVHSAAHGLTADELVPVREGS